MGRKNAKVRTRHASRAAQRAAGKKPRRKAEDQDRPKLAVPRPS